MIFNPVIQSGGGGVTMDELFFGNESTVSVSVEGYKALLVLYSNYAGTNFMQVGHVPLNMVEEGNYVFIGYDGDGGNLVSALYSNGTIAFEANNGGSIYAVYGIK